MKRKILIVVDYQYDFVSKNGKLSIDNSEKIEKKIQNLIDSNIYEDIIYTFDTHNKKDYKLSEESKIFPNIHCEFGKKGWWLYKIKPKSNEEVKKLYNNQMYPRNLKINNEYFFIKDKFSIWEGCEEYEIFIKNKYEKNKKNIEFDVCGVAMDVCVNMNILGLVERGYKVNLINEATMAITETSKIKTIKDLKKLDVNIVEKK